MLIKMISRLNNANGRGKSEKNISVHFCLETFQRF